MNHYNDARDLKFDLIFFFSDAVQTCRFRWRHVGHRLNNGPLTMPVPLKIQRQVIFHLC